MQPWAAIIAMGSCRPLNTEGYILVLNCMGTVKAIGQLHIERCHAAFDDTVKLIYYSSLDNFTLFINRDNEWPLANLSFNFTSTTCRRWHFIYVRACVRGAMWSLNESVIYQHNHQRVCVAVSIFL